MLSISRRNLITLGAGFFAASALAGCGDDGKAVPGGGASSKDSYKIGVLQLTEHGALDQTNEGFVAAIEKSGIDAKIDQQNAQNDQSACQTIASKLVNDGDDLIFAIATPAAQAVAGATTEIPIVGSAITDYAEGGLVESNDAPGGNVTGTSDLTPRRRPDRPASPVAAQCQDRGHPLLLRRVQFRGAGATRRGGS